MKIHFYGPDGFAFGLDIPSSINRLDVNCDTVPVLLQDGTQFHRHFSTDAPPPAIRLITNEFEDADG
jgi:hypothetical protein